ncbi:MAG: hypothetical protein K0U37_06895 [Gammaproteobacteria bacterium]|nr:hypothetical protein [Gammaproteobacteria bacterium]
MIPLLVGAAVADASAYYIVAALGTGGLAGYFWPKAAPKPGHVSRSNTSTREKEHLRKAEKLEVESRKSRKVVLETIGEKAVEDIEKVLESSYKARLKLNSLTAVFDHQTSELKKTTETLKGMVNKLDLANHTAQETARHLSTEIVSLKRTISEGSQAICEATKKLSAREEELARVVGEFERMKVDLERTQLEYSTQVSTLTEALQRSNKAVNQKLGSQSHQEEQIHALQDKIEMLTQCLRAVTQKSENNTLQPDAPQDEPEKRSSVGFF